MNPRIGLPGVLMTLLLASPAGAQDGELEEGAALFKKECMVCHGSAAREVGERGPAPLRQAWLYAAVQTDQATLADIPAAALPAPVAADGNAALHLAVSPPYGPSLRGVYGRLAGSVEGFSYSNTFQQTLKGMEWNEATLDVFLTNTQVWVPGIYMFYKQKNADIRRKIIQYLKANR
jgi:cytochrome c2